MPRDVRLDAEGALHHVVIRGIEKRNIFLGPEDYLDFLDRLSIVFGSTGTISHAWSLLPNHAHLFLKSARAGLPTIMRRILTGYAGAFNRRHRRVGHLFQNRYQSTLVEEDPYLLALIAYIHLNPFLHGFLDAWEQIDDYPWTGHNAMLGKVEIPWMNVDFTMDYISPAREDAKKKYLQMLQERAASEVSMDLEGGGLVRSAGGWKAITELRRGRERWAFDERILGSGPFVESLLQQLGKQAPSENPSKSILLHSLIPKWASMAGILPSELLDSCKKRSVTRLRKKIAFLAIRYLGMAPIEVSRVLKCSPSTISRGIEKLTENVDDEFLNWIRIAMLDCQIATKAA